MTTTKGLLDCTTQGVVNMVLHKLHFGVTIHPGVSLVKRGPGIVQRGSPALNIDHPTRALRVGDVRTSGTVHGASRVLGS